MSEPEEIQFACIGCGALNPIGAAACSGCGHPFGGPPPPPPPGTPAPPPVRRPAPVPELDPNPYTPPAAGVARHSTFRIGTAMIAVAVIAVGLGAFAADEGLGVSLGIGLIPALVRMLVVSARGGPGGRPSSAGEVALSFFLTFVMSYVIVTASLIAFGVTCIPIAVIGDSSDSLPVALAVGAAAGLGMAIWSTRVVLKAARARAEAKWHDSQIRWK